MPEFRAVEIKGHIRHVVKVEAGEKIFLCRCYGSKNFPFCDGSHNQSHHNVGPAVIEVKEDTPQAEEDQPAE